jgi:hypothetical protein
MEQRGMAATEDRKRFTAETLRARSDFFESYRSVSSAPLR